MGHRRQNSTGSEGCFCLMSLVSAAAQELDIDQMTILGRLVLLIWFATLNRMVVEHIRL
jgi:hypothetical protein